LSQDDEPSEPKATYTGLSQIVELQTPTWFLDVSWFIINFAVQVAIKSGIGIPWFEDPPK
jgi:hypothetical protein